jgi:hypothetical protein
MLKNEVCGDDYSEENADAIPRLEENRKKERLVGHIITTLYKTSRKVRRMYRAREGRCSRLVVNHEGAKSSKVPVAKEEHDGQKRRWV